MNRIFTLFIALLFSGLAFSQNKLDYDNDSRWFWGINAGTTWSTADVAKKHNFGWGLTLGKSFNYDYGKAISFDIRARYLGGKWLGQNSDTTAISPNDMIYKDYYNANGHSVLNFETIANELSLELVLHANSLRGRTGLDPYIFGGIGYTWYKTYGDLTDANGSIYNYDSLPNIGASSAYALQDNNYETALSGTTKGAVSGAFMPSAGFGLGYQFGPRFSMGLEHKTTFTLDDVFDGQVNSAGKRPNDWYHYTSAYMRFQIRDHKPTTNTTNNNSLGNVNNYSGGEPTALPIVDFTNPSASGMTVNSPNYVVRAKIQNVTNTSFVIFKQNGNYNTNFTFNPSTQLFESIVTLTPGQNVFELTGTNTLGSDQEQTVVIYTREANNPPVVTYTNPTTSPLTVQNPNYTVTASVINVSSNSQVTMTNNNAPVAFTFDLNTHVATANITLTVGTNIVTTTGTNAYGTDSKSTTIIYNPAQTVQPPVVYFVDPNVNPYNTNQNTFTINADVLNVNGTQNITFKQNGTVNQNFVYNGQNKRLTSSVVLTPGQNVFEVIGTNVAGSASASTIIVYNRPAPKPPIVSFINPSVNPTETNNPSFNLSATVLNVSAASQITVKLNNQSITNYTFTAASSSVGALLNLIPGANVVTVSGTNSDGTDSKQTTIIYKRTETVQPPVVQFTSPNVDPYNTAQSAYNIVASVFNVANQSGVNVNVNGANFTNFSFTNSTVMFPISLIEGANVITITGTNTAGTASESQTIIYKQPVTVIPPVVSFLDPAVNPTTVYAPTYTVKARVRYVSSASQIELKINGQVSTNFIYSASNETMEFTTGLVQNSNSIEIKATNSAGSDQESTIIIYRVPNPTLPPVVTITNPATVSTTVSVATAAITATVLNVDSQQNIQVIVNGVSTPNFTYNATTKQVNLTMNLNLGSNSLLISGTNSAGNASDNRTVIYKQEQVVTPPFVTFINPATSGTTVNTAGYVLKARVLNVTMASQIQVVQDAQVVSPALWSFNTATNEVTMNTNLNPGNNVFTVTGTNSGGTHSASTAITYKVPVIVCDKPVIVLAGTAANKSALQTTDYTLNFTVDNITSGNQISIKLNGQLQSPGTYNATTHGYSKDLTVNEGQNVIEIIATNACGETTAITTVIYKPVQAPCLAPTVTRLLPASASQSGTNAAVQIQASVTNVESASEVQVLLNNTVVSSSFDAATHLVIANVNTSVGLNQVIVRVTTKCGTADVAWQFTRLDCSSPLISFVSATASDNATVQVEAFGLVLAISGVTASTNIEVTQNGQAIGFVFNPQTFVMNLDRNLVVGNNEFVVKATNSCGDRTFKFNVRRTEKPRIIPPTISITNPSTSPSAVSQPGMTVSIVTGNVLAASQVSILVNGASTNFNFNPANGTITFDANFEEGANTIVATAITPAGSATDSKIVNYTPVVVVQMPVIQFTSPSACPFTAPRGVTTMTGTVTNVSNASQVVILYNNAPVNFNSSISNNVLTFSFDINVSNVTVNLPIVVTATNAAGSATASCQITIAGHDNNGHGNNTDGNDESNPGQGSGGPNGETGGEEDDEDNKGNGNGNAGRAITPVEKPVRAGQKTPVLAPKPTSTPTSTPTRVIKP